MQLWQRQLPDVLYTDQLRSEQHADFLWPKQPDPRLVGQQLNVHLKWHTFDAGIGKSSYFDSSIAVQRLEGLVLRWAGGVGGTSIPLADSRTPATQGSAGTASTNVHCPLLNCAITSPGHCAKRAIAFQIISVL